MKFTLNNVLGVGGIISMIISPVLAFSGIKTDVARHDLRIQTLEEEYKDFAGQQKAQTIILVKIASKLGISTDSLSVN